MARKRSRVGVKSSVKHSEPACERTAFVGDVHVPYHDQRAVDLVLAFLRWFEPRVLFLIGDIIDFYQLSRFDKDPDRILGLQDELDEATALLGQFRDAVGPECRIHYREGNHEFRLNKFLCQNPELSPLRNIQLTSLLEFGRFDIQHCDYRGHLEHRGFLVEHGDIVRKHSGYTARGMMEKRGICGISGHTHRLASHYVTNYSGTKVWYENGCICDLAPEYILGTPNWQHGFSVGHAIKGDDRFFIEQVPIIKHKILYQGHLWK